MNKKYFVRNCSKIILSILILLLMLPNCVQATEIDALDTEHIVIQNRTTEMPNQNAISEEDMNIDMRFKTWYYNYYLSFIEKQDMQTYFEIPLYNQRDYPDVPYGDHGTIYSHGCGITCVAMLATYYLDKEILPDELAFKYGDYNTNNGSLWVLFEDSAEDLSLPFLERTYDWNVVYQALKDGKVVVSLQGSDGIFTSGGHFILLTGMNEEDKIFVNDPNGFNYNKEKLKDGFNNGFEINQIRAGEVVYWIYDTKEFDEKAILIHEFVDSIKNNTFQK